MTQLRAMVLLAVQPIRLALQFGATFEEVVNRGLGVSIDDCPKEQIHEFNVMLFALLAEAYNEAAGAGDG